MATNKQKSRFASHEGDERRQTPRDGEITNGQMRGALERALRETRFSEGDAMRDKIMEVFEHALTPVASEQATDDAPESAGQPSDSRESSEGIESLARRLEEIHTNTQNSPDRPADAVTWQAVAEKLMADPEAFKEFNKMAEPIVEDWEVKDGKAYPVIADGIEDVTEISEYMGEDRQGLRYMEARTFVMYRRDESGNFKKAGGEGETVAASEVQELIDEIINGQMREKLYVNPNQRPSDALQAEMTKFEKLTASFERTAYDMYGYSRNYDKSPEIRAFEAATRRVFVFPKAGESYCASYLESGATPSRPRLCFFARDTRHARVSYYDPNSHSPRLGVRRQLRVSRLFEL